MDEEKKLHQSLEKLINDISKSEDTLKREAYMDKLIDFFNYELSKEQQYRALEFMITQVSLVKIVNSPELYRKRGNMRIRIHLFNWMCVGFIVLLIGVLFSDQEYMIKINKVINTILKVWGL